LVNSGVLEVNVAQSESHATHNGLDSTGAASSDGATVKGANAITLVVLHAETTSAGKGETYLLNVNGNKIGTDKQFSQCPLALGPLAEIKVNCVKATGANGVTKVTADALGALVTPAGLGVKAASAAGSSAQGSATQVLSAPALEAPAPAPAAQLPARSAPLLPRTGATGLGVLSLLGVALATVGAALRYLAGRPVREAVSPPG
jgi:hypothetical protein